MSMDSFLEAVERLQRPHVTVDRHAYRAAEVHITEPAERDGLRELLRAHHLNPSTDTRFYVHYVEPLNGSQSTGVAIDSYAPGADIGLAIAETLLAWEASNVVDVPGMPGDYANWPGLVVLLNPGDGASSADWAAARTIGAALIEQAKEHAQNGPFGSPLTPSSPDAALLGVLIAGSLPVVMANRHRFGLQPGDAGAWARLVEVAHAEIRLADKEKAVRAAVSVAPLRRGGPRAGRDLVGPGT